MTKILKTQWMGSAVEWRAQRKESGRNNPVQTTERKQTRMKTSTEPQRPVG